MGNDGFPKEPPSASCPLSGALFGWAGNTDLRASDGTSHTFPGDSASSTRHHFPGESTSSARHTFPGEILSDSGRDFIRRGEDAKGQVARRRGGWGVGEAFGEALELAGDVEWAMGLVRPCPDP